MPRIGAVCPRSGSSKFLAMVEHVFVWEDCSAEQSCFAPDFFFFFSFSFFTPSQQKACPLISKCCFLTRLNKEKKNEIMKKQNLVWRLRPSDGQVHFHLHRVEMTSVVLRTRRLPIFISSPSLHISRRFPSVIYIR